MSDLLRLRAILTRDPQLYTAAAELRMRKLLGVPETKDCGRQFEVKRLSVKLADWAAGEFDAYASTWDLDRQGDRITRGAFASTIKENAGRVPLCWQHDHAAVVGVAAELAEDERGLKFRGRITRAAGRGAEALALMEMGALRQFSIGYFVRDFRREGQIRVLTDIELVEVSCVSVPANPHAMTV